ncbi:MAG: membrane fusion protein [Candidatus Azotimanducaceae bacterium]
MNSKANSGLYRQEALCFQASRGLGRVILVQPLSFRIYTLALLSFTCALIFYLYWAEYARKATVVGYLEPSKGIVRVYPNLNSGIVKRVLVKNGQAVASGDVLVELGFPNSLESGGDALELVSRELSHQETLLGLETERVSQNFETEILRSNQRLEEIDVELAELAKYVALQRDQIDVANKHVASLSKLRKNNSISEIELLRSVSEKIEQEKSLAILTHQQLQVSARRTGINHELNRLPDRFASEKTQLALRLSEIRQRITQIKVRRGVTVTAPESGTINFLQVKRGEAVSTNKPILGIQPEDSQLQAILLIPSSAVGFIESGMPLRISFDSFPHQQFGTQSGNLLSISKAPISPDDYSGPIGIKAPVYLARAKLQNPYVLAFGERKALVPGMLFVCDIILERRSMIDWMLEPLYSLRGRTQ